MSDALPLRLSGFADEIGPDLDLQIGTMRRTGVTHFELRGIGGANVLTFSDGQARDYRRRIEDAGLAVAVIGSPCGKQPIDRPEDQTLDDFKRARDLAGLFGATLIRVFSFYPPGGEGKGPLDPMEGRVVELLSKQAGLLDGTDLTMVHENEKGIFGDTGERCLRLLKGVNSPRLRAAFDFANFVQIGEDPAANWPKLEPFVAHVHIKDAKADGTVVPAGEGVGGVGPILSDAYAGGYRGFVSLEPHLRVAGHSGGETGPALWETAVAALRRVCAAHNVPLEGGAA